MMMTGVSRAGMPCRNVVATLPIAKPTRGIVLLRVISHVVPIRLRPIRRPGTTPARNSRLRETPVTTAKMIIGMLGGMITPIVDDDAVTAADRPGLNPRSIIGLIMMEPTADVSATAAPVIPPKNMLVAMLTCASPPRTKPTSASAKSKIDCAMPPRLMSAPASTKSGIASSTKLSAAVVRRCATSAIGTPPNARANMLDASSAKPTGTSTTSRTTNVRTSTVIMGSCVPGIGPRPVSPTPPRGLQQ